MFSGGKGDFAVLCLVKEQLRFRLFLHHLVPCQKTLLTSASLGKVYFCTWIKSQRTLCSDMEDPEEL